MVHTSGSWWIWMFQINRRMKWFLSCCQILLFVLLHFQQHVSCWQASAFIYFKSLFLCLHSPQNRYRSVRHRLRPGSAPSLTVSHAVNLRSFSVSPCFIRAVRVLQVTRLQYLNALMASRVGQSPDPPEIKILPNSQTKLLNDRNTTQGSFALNAVWSAAPRISKLTLAADDKSH